MESEILWCVLGSRAAGFVRRLPSNRPGPKKAPPGRTVIAWCVTKSDLGFQEPPKYKQAAVLQGILLALITVFVTRVSWRTCPNHAGNDARVTVVKAVVKYCCCLSYIAAKI